MNRRSFIGNLAKVACFSILPGATTYARQWKTLDSGLAVPEYYSVRSLGYFLYQNAIWLRPRLSPQTHENQITKDK